MPLVFSTTLTGIGIKIKDDHLNCNLFLTSADHWVRQDNPPLSLLLPEQHTSKDPKCRNPQYNSLD